MFCMFFYIRCSKKIILQFSHYQLMVGESLLPCLTLLCCSVMRTILLLDRSVIDSTFLDNPCKHSCVQLPLPAGS